MKMKYWIKSCCLLLMSFLILTSLPVTTLAADSSVTFSNGKIIVFEPGSVYTDSDLFDNFKNIMPGDVRTEEILVQNQSKDFDFIKVYLRAILHDETGNPISESVLTVLQQDPRLEPLTELEYMYSFLSQLALKVSNGSNTIYTETSDQLNGLASNVYLGTFRKGESTTLNVELTVPVELDNEFSNRIGEVDWVFVVEGFNDPAPPPTLDITVKKVWQGTRENRPDITIRLLADKVEVEHIVLKYPTVTYTFSDLPVYSSDGKKINYTVTEDPVKGYKSKINGFEIINTPNGDLPYTGTSSGLTLPVLGMLLTAGGLGILKTRKNKER